MYYHGCFSFSSDFLVFSSFFPMLVVVLSQQETGAKVLDITQAKETLQFRCFNIIGTENYYY